jgi:hypothetical protein
MFSACLCLCLMSLASDSKTVYQCELKIYGQKAGVERVLSNPTLAILNGKYARMIVGGEEPIPNTSPVQFEPTGTIVNCMVTGSKGDECHVDITFSNVSKQPSTEGSLIMNQKSVRYRGKWKLNETKTVTLGDVEELKDVKLDLRLTIVDPATLK